MAKTDTGSTRAPRGSKPVSAAFFSALDAAPEAQRIAIARAAQIMIRDELRTRREKTKAATLKARTATKTAAAKTVAAKSAPAKASKAGMSKAKTPVAKAKAPRASAMPAEAPAKEMPSVRAIKARRSPRAASAATE